MFYCGTLPEGWLQGIRTSSTGHTLMCYFNPDGHRFRHKRDIEKHLGYQLPTRSDNSTTQCNQECSYFPTTKRFVTDLDAIPSWPDEEQGWLPTNFRVSYRQKQDALHQIFIPPDQEEGFIWNKQDVIDYLNGTAKTLTKFAFSQRAPRTDSRADNTLALALLPTEPKRSFTCKSNSNNSGPVAKHYRLEPQGNSMQICSLPMQTCNGQTKPVAGRALKLPVSAQLHRKRIILRLNTNREHVSLVCNTFAFESTVRCKLSIWWC